MKQKLWDYARAATDDYNAACMSVFSTPEERSYLHGKKDAYITTLVGLTGRDFGSIAEELDG